MVIRLARADNKFAVNRTLGSTASWLNTTVTKVTDKTLYEKDKALKSADWASRSLRLMALRWLIDNFIFVCFLGSQHNAYGQNIQFDHILISRVEAACFVMSHREFVAAVGPKLILLIFFPFFLDTSKTHTPGWMQTAPASGVGRTVDTQRHWLWRVEATCSVAPPRSHPSSTGDSTVCLAV